MIFQEWFSVNEKGNLVMEGCDLTEIASEFKTPLFVYNETLMRERCRKYLKSLREIFTDGEIIYAGKSFIIKEMCRLLKEEGLSLDVVSGGELFTALAVDFPAEKIYFHGNNKTEEELEMAVKSGVGRIVVDSLDELELLDKVTAQTGISANIYLRIKPGISAHTHSYIQTGQADSKFGLGIDDGMAKEAVDKALKKEKIALKGLHCHIGSQIFDVHEPFKLAARKMVALMKEIKEEYGCELKELNLGGGLGIRYTAEDTPEDAAVFVKNLAEAVKAECEENGINLERLSLEPGRSIAGEAGITLYTIGTIKKLDNIRTYVSVDGGMMDNLRPALYDAVYDGVLANRAGEEADAVVTLAGKACESGDILIKEMKVPMPHRDDIMAVFSTGSYHFSMYSNYNRNPRPAVVFLKEGAARLVVKKESYEDMVSLEI